MNISKEKFTELAKEHLIALESYKIDKNGNKPIEIFGIEKLYEAINYTHCCKSDSEQLVCVVDYLSNFTKGKNYECKPDGKNHFEVYDDFGDWYSVHKKCFSKTELAN